MDYKEGTHLIVTFDGELFNVGIETVRFGINCKVSGFGQAGKRASQFVNAKFTDKDITGEDPTTIITDGLALAIGAHVEDETRTNKTTDR